MSRRQLPVLLDRDLLELQSERLVKSETFGLGVRETAGGQGEAVSCSAGCSACCYNPVMVSLLEGLSLFRWLAERGMWTADLRNRLQEHATSTWGLAFEVWYLSSIPCPFLASNKCSVYEGRPFICRTTWSIGDPIDCQPHRFGPKAGIIPRADVVREYNRLEAQKLRAHGLMTVQLPLSKAVLVAEAVLSGRLDLENIASTLIKEYQATG